MSCRCPTLKFLPFSSTGVVNANCKCELARALATLVSECIENGSKLSLKVPENRTGSCGITAMARLTCSSFKVEISTPSIKNLPVFYVPIKIDFFGEDKLMFDSMIEEYVRKNKKKQLI